MRQSLSNVGGFPAWPIVGLLRMPGAHAAEHRALVDTEIARDDVAIHTAPGQYLDLPGRRDVAANRPRHRDALRLHIGGHLGQRPDEQSARRLQLAFEGTIDVDRPIGTQDPSLKAGGCRHYHLRPLLVLPGDTASSQHAALRRARLAKAERLRPLSYNRARRRAETQTPPKKQ